MRWYSPYWYRRWWRYSLWPAFTAYLAAAFVGAVSGGILASVGLEVLGLGPQNVPTIGRTLFYAFKYTALFKGMWWWWGTTATSGWGIC